jgi:cytoskeletal protein CcmA (bactofilin family)
LSKTYDDLKLAEQLQRGSSVVSAGLRVKGEISGNEDLLVNGIVECPIQLEEKMLIVGPSGELTANVVAREVIVFGEVKGNLVARDRIQIKKEGSVVGDLTTGRIVRTSRVRLRSFVRRRMLPVKNHRNHLRRPHRLLTANGSDTELTQRRKPS